MLCTDVSRSQVAIKSVLTMKIQNAQQLTIFEIMQKQRCMGYFQTPPQLFIIAIKNDQEIQESNFYVNSYFRQWLET